MARDKEAFLSRWSRLKRDEAAKAGEAAKAKAVDAPAPAGEEAPQEALPPLPPVEELTPESDYAPFMNAKVPLETRRAALKKLFADPKFGLPDPYEAYSEDWTVGEAISPQMLKTLNQAKRILFDEAEKPPGEAAQGGDEKAAGGETAMKDGESATKEDDGTGTQGA